MAPCAASVKQSSEHAIISYQYESCKQLLKQYQRPFTVLELFAGNGNLSFTIAKKYNAVCVILEPKRHEQLFDRCVRHTELKNIVLTTHNCSLADLVRLGECEHFDVIFAPDLTQHYGSKWQEALSAILTFGDHIILQTPPKNSKLRSVVEQYCAKKGGHCIAPSPEPIKNHIGNLYLFTQNKKFLARRRWDYFKDQRPGEYIIKSSFTEKILIKEKIRPQGTTISTWHPGINLLTFKKLDGIYPTSEMIREMIKPMADLQHNDLRIFNIIMQGKQLVPIDVNEKERNNTARQLLPQLLKHFKKRGGRINADSSEVADS